MSFKKRILAIVILFIAVSLAYRIATDDREFDSFWWDVTFRKVALSRFDCIFFGVLAAWFRFYYRKIWERTAAAAFIAGVMIYLVHIQIPKEITRTYMNVIYLSISPIYIMLWFPLADKLKNAETLLEKGISVISILSYAIYLLNLMIIQIFNEHLSEFMTDHISVKYLMFWLITLSVSYVMYRFYENPLASFRTRFFVVSKTFKNTRKQWSRARGK